MKIQDIILSCSESSRKKGFNSSIHMTQVCHIVTGMSEAMEYLTPSGNKETERLKQILIDECKRYAFYQRKAENHSDISTVCFQDLFLEELAEVVIKISSYVGGNDWSDEFCDILKAKMDKTNGRVKLSKKK